MPRLTSGGDADNFYEKREERIVDARFKAYEEAYNDYIQFVWGLALILFPVTVILGAILW